MAPASHSHDGDSRPIVAFLTARFGGQSGWLCLGWIAGDPRVEPLREEWYQLPRQLTAAIDWAEAQAEHGMNLYVAPCLFAERRRCYATALPTAWLWLDDVAFAGAELIETSRGNYQSWLPLDRPLNAEERSALQRSLRDATGNADTCSADAVHLARLPGGWNCKQRGNWQVRVARAAAPPICVDNLRMCYPASRQPTRIDLPDADWDKLPPGQVLAQSRRFQALVEANAQLSRLVADEPVALTCHGYQDDSRSARRAIFVCQLLHARYPHDEIRALASHFAPLLDSGRGEVLFRRDIHRLLGKYTPSDYVPQATRVTAGPTTPAHSGRPIALTAAALLDFYHQYADCGRRGIVLGWTRHEVARELHVSADTIGRRESELTAAGVIRREVSADRQRSVVILSPATWDVDAQGTEMPNPQASLLDTDPNRACPDAASEAAIPAALPPTAAPVSQVGAEKTHHLAAEPLASSDSSLAADAVPSGRGATAARMGVSFPEPTRRILTTQMARPTSPQPVHPAAEHSDAVACRAPPGTTRQS
jgi:hypothetical protein